MAFALFSQAALVKADEPAVFYVQTAQTLENGKIEVRVYLHNAAALGGVDLILRYDPQKVSFISSSLGSTLSSSYADIYHDAPKAEIHYVILYPEKINAHGTLLEAEFQLKEGSSYQPELIVNDLVDNTDEINDIPYTVSYQQADGTWETEQDVSQKAADPKIAQETLEQYGAPEDQNEDPQNQTFGITADNRISGNVQIGETGETAPEEAGTGEMKSVSGNPVVLLIALFAALLFAAGIASYRRRQR